MTGEVRPVRVGGRRYPHPLPGISQPTVLLLQRGPTPKRPDQLLLAVDDPDGDRPLAVPYSRLLIGICGRPTLRGSTPIVGARQRVLDTPYLAP